jgi:hypothetical protein
MDTLPDAIGQPADSVAGSVYAVGVGGERHQTSDNRYQTSDIRQQTTDIRHQTSDIRHQTSDIRHQTSDIRHQTTDKRQTDIRQETTDKRQQILYCRMATSCRAGRGRSVHLPAKKLTDNFINYKSRKMRMLLKSLFLFFLVWAIHDNVSAQSLTQTIRGTVIDQDSRLPIPGANILILDSEPLRGAVSDIDGHFRLEEVALGRVNVGVYFLGYEDRIFPNIQLTSAKEVVLQVELVESLTQLEEAVVTYEQKKTDTRDEMALVSARAFTVEETSRYAGAFNDPARMVSAYSGITGNASGTNEIIVRGNSPKGVLWRLEGVEIPNPNHFSSEGSTGGPINALNSTMLANSDFFTGAFAPQYGNAYSSVFDIQLRNGNNDKREYTFQAGFIGLDFTMEGPFQKDYDGSYLFNYRYSTLALLDQAGVVDYGGVPKYQDLSFKVNLPTQRLGRFSIFGLAGTSSILSELKDEDVADLIVERHDVQSELAVMGINHTLLIDEKTYLKSNISVSENGSIVEGETRNEGDVFYESLDSRLRKYAVRAGTNLYHKLNARNRLQAGILYTELFYNFQHKEFDYELDRLRSRLDSEEHTGLWQGYVSWKHRFTEKLEAVGGMHAQYFVFNETHSLEPRLSLSWQAHPRHRFFAGFGVHSRLATITEYLTHEVDEKGEKNYFNRDLELPKARHYVLGHDFQLGPNTRFKTELYYQDLYDVPVGAAPGSTFSILNDIGMFTLERLTNDGFGRNMGAEITLERFLDKGYYYLLTASLYESQYKAADGEWRDTRFNGNYVVNVLGGKEFPLKSKANKEKTLSVNTRLLMYGGAYYTPIDLEASRIAGEEVRLDEQAFSARGGDVFRFDLGITYAINRPKTTQTLKFEAQNLTSHDALVEQYYNKYSGKIMDIRQLPILPMVFYGISF